MALRVTTCCGCVELRTGCFILGYLGLIANIILLPILIFGFDTLVQKTSAETSDPATVKAVFFILLAIVLVSLVFAIMFVIGLHQNKRQYIKCYLIFTLTTTVIFFFLYILRIIYGGPVQVQMVFQLLINLAVQIYYIIVIRSYYFQLKEEDYQGKAAAINKA